ncbi:hypothetical protein [Kitasatospora sp. MAP5-34]|uniref:hypothetical protein n=1 Tax=Kitasatospora sp. MAP5-34 TaxID=3035102 RepID=UPI00247D7341|nr:hypothetical protein [Kitasatospora sp. MAP5-34]
MNIGSIAGLGRGVGTTGTPGAAGTPGTIGAAGTIGAGGGGEGGAGAGTSGGKAGRAGITSSATNCGSGPGFSTTGIPGTAATATDPLPARTLNEVGFTMT